MDEQTIDLRSAPRAPQAHGGHGLATTVAAQRGDGAGTGARGRARAGATVPLQRRDSGEVPATGQPRALQPGPVQQGPVLQGGAPAGRRWRRRKYAAVAAVSGTVALLVGMGIGGAGSSSQLTEAHRRADTAVQQAAEAEAAIADAHQEMAEAQEDAADAAEAQADAEAALAAARSAADDASARATDLQEQLTAAQAAAARAATSTGTSNGTSAGGSSTGSRSSGGTSGGPSASEDEPVTSSAVSYANCTAARAAGAAPVRVGDPGYSRKLDRDGDGVGCE